MKQARAVLADDEEQLRIYLRNRLQDLWPGLDIVGEAANGVQALELIESLKPDVAFLDISMPGLSGMEVAGKIAGHCRVVFITAYDRYAVAAFENRALDYILKPVNTERLKKTVARLQEAVEISLTPHDHIRELLEEVVGGMAGTPNPGYLRWIRAQHRDTIRLIPVDDVILFQSSAKYTCVVTSTGESLIRKTIKDLEAELDPQTFWRIHRGTIIRAAAIDRVSSSLTGRLAVKMKHHEEVLTVSRSYAHLFKQM